MSEIMVLDILSMSSSRLSDVSFSGAPLPSAARGRLWWEDALYGPAVRFHALVVHGVTYAQRHWNQKRPGGGECCRDRGHTRRYSGRQFFFPGSETLVFFCFTECRTKSSPCLSSLSVHPFMSWFVSMLQAPTFWEAARCWCKVGRPSLGSEGTRRSLRISRDSRSNDASRQDAATIERSGLKPKSGISNVNPCKSKMIDPPVYKWRQPRINKAWIIN